MTTLCEERSTSSASIQLNHKRIVNALRAAFDLPQHRSFTSFIESKIPLNQEDRLSNFHLDVSPWVRAVAGWVDDPGVEWITLIQGSQTAKTTVQMLFLLYLAQKEPCRLLWVQSTEEEAKTFITGRLRPFIDNYDADAIKKKSWKIEAFKVGKARVKIGFASNEASLRTLPAPYLVGDEVAMWKHPVAMVKKRTRTYAGRRKGIFATTPPRNGTHHSWQEAKDADWFQWWVPCPKCGEFQPLLLSGLKWDGKDGKAWNYKRVEETAHYECRTCRHKIYEADKGELIKRGKLVCVDPDNEYKQKAQTGNKSRTLQVSALYSVFTTWGELAVAFLKAKHGSIELLKIFVTDELAEAPYNLEEGEQLKDMDLLKYVDRDRASGYLEGYDLYSQGIDVQRNGELYVVTLGWKRGVLPTPHVLKSDVVAWHSGASFEQKWFDLLEYNAAMQATLARSCIDATDGMVESDIFALCQYAGRQYMPLKDSTTLHVKIIVKAANGKYGAQKEITVNSDKVKDDVAACLSRPPGEVGAISFPADISPEFLKAMTTEKRTTDKFGKSGWAPVYSHAPNHFFSALTYAFGAMEEFRFYVQGAPQEEADDDNDVKVLNRGVEL